ncbi:MAG: NAD(P)H-dependent oxidoreductase subunit E [Bacteroidales bacterium]|nr:NAD(P)H-dependent oxidoreductase subunit E [Bacteroidales bacterium]
MEQIETLFSEILQEHPSQEGSLIPLLQKAQAKYKYISPEIVQAVADYLGITENRVFGVASFYSQFRFTEPAEHTISVCLGTACHVNSGETLVEALERDMGIKPGECTADKKFELERVACLGCCALAPVVKIDNDIYGKLNLVKLKEIVSKYE